MACVIVEVYRLTHLFSVQLMQYIIFVPHITIHKKYYICDTNPINTLFDRFDNSTHLYLLCE